MPFSIKHLSDVHYVITSDLRPVNPITITPVFVQ